MEVLSEHMCQGWLEGYLLTGRHGFFSCYEAFIHIIDSMFNQHAKWLKVTRHIPWRRPIASLNYLLTSHVWRQDHNGFSHQDPGFIDHVVNKKADVVRVYLPPDANTLLSVTDHCLRSRNYVNVIVAGKQPALQWLDMDAAIKHCTAGIGIWEWASNDQGGEPDVVMACCGDVPTLETLAAVDLLRRNFPDLKIRVVNVVDLMTLQPASEHPHGLSDREFDSLFTTDKPVIFAFHGYPWLIHRLTYRRTNHDNLHVRGYKEEGTTTTPFDMAVLNDLDRFHLAGDVIDRVPQLTDVRGARQAVAPRQADRAQATTSRSTAKTCRRSATGNGPGRDEALTGMDHSLTLVALIGAATVRERSSTNENIQAVTGLEGAARGLFDGRQRLFRRRLPRKLRRPPRARFRQAAAQRFLLHQPRHGGGDFFGALRIELQSRIGCDAGYRLDIRAAGGDARGQRFQHRQAEALEPGGIEERPGARVELVQVLARNPAGELHRVGQPQALPQIVQRAGEEAVHAAHHQAEIRMAAAENGERPQQAIQVLVRMQRGDGQQKTFGAVTARRRAISKKTGSTPSSARCGFSAPAGGRNGAGRRRWRRNRPGADAKPAPTQYRKNFQNGRSNQRKYSGCRLCWRS